MGRTDILRIQEEDGSPAGSPGILKVTNGTLTDNGDGSFSLDTGGGGAGLTTVELIDDESVSSVTTLNFKPQTSAVAPAALNLVDNGGGSVNLEGLGDVAYIDGGPSVADHSIARFDGTSGRLIQSSTNAPTYDDAGAVTIGAGGLSVTGTSLLIGSVTMSTDLDVGNLTLGSNGGDGLITGKDTNDSVYIEGAGTGKVYMKETIFNEQLYFGNIDGDINAGLRLANIAGAIEATIDNHDVGSMYYDTDNDRIRVYDGSAWGTVGGGVGGMDDLTDATITSVATGEILKYDGAEWINNTLAEAGIAAASHTHTQSDISDVTSTAGEINYLDGSTVVNGRVVYADGTKFTGEDAFTFTTAGNTLQVGTTGEAGDVWAHGALQVGLTTKVQLKNSSGELQIRNNADSDYADLRVKNLVVEGTTTTIESETVTIADNVIELNSDVTGAPSEDAGIEINRGTSTNSALTWDETADVWKAGIAGSEVEISLLGHTHTLSDITDITASDGVQISGSDIALDVNGLTEFTGIDLAADYLVYYDATAADHKKILWGDMQGAARSGFSDGEILFYDSSTDSKENAESNFLYDKSTNKLYLSESATVDIAGQFNIEAEDVNNGVNVVGQSGYSAKYFVAKNNSLTELFYIDSGGGAYFADDVGIGIAPTRALHVEKGQASGFLGYLENTNALGNGLQIITAGTSSSITALDVNTDDFAILGNGKARFNQSSLNTHAQVEITADSDTITAAGHDWAIPLELKVDYGQGGLDLSGQSGGGTDLYVSMRDSDDIDNANYFWMGLDTNGVVGPAGTNAIVSSKNGTGTTNDLILLANDNASATPQITIGANTEFVGINNTSPVAHLDIGHATQATFNLSHDGGVGNYGRISLYHTGITGNKYQGVIELVDDGSYNADFVYYAKDDGTEVASLEEKFRFDSSTNRFGIGTSTPDSTLDVEAVSGEVPLNITQLAATSADPTLATFLTSTGWVSQMFATDVTGEDSFGIGTNTSHGLGLYVNNSTTSPSVYVKSDGNVGINNTNPEYALDVVGATNISSDTAGSNGHITFHKTDESFASPMTGLGWVDATTNGFIGDASSDGGVSLQGFSDGDNGAVAIVGNIGVNSPSDAVVRIAGWKSDGGTNRESITGTEKLVTFEAGTTEIAYIDATGNATFGGNVSTIGIDEVTTITGATGGLTITTSTNGDLTLDPGGSGITTVNAGSGGVTISTDAGNADINITPHGTGNVTVGNLTFDADQTVGVGQDNYVLTYDNATGLIGLEAAGAGSGTMTTVKSNGSQVGGADIVTLDFASTFTATESPDTEINIDIATGGVTDDMLASTFLKNVIEDTTPQLGGNLDTNGFTISFDHHDGITDDSGNELLMFHKNASAVNYLEIGNNVTGSSPILYSYGSDANVGLAFQSKGAGAYEFLGWSGSQATVKLFEDTANGTNSIGLTTAASLASDYTLTLPSATDTLVGKATTDTFTNKSGNISMWTNDSGYITATLTQEQVEDYAGGLVSNATGTHTGITITYQDATGDMDFVVDHDAAQNFVANEHIDHTAVTLTAGEGLSGGGDISASRTFDVDISPQTDIGTPDSGDLLLIEDITDGSIKKVQIGNLPTGGGGEANTASNVGTAGVGVFKQKTGVDLEFKKINAGSSKVTITDDTGNNEIDIDVAEANIDHDALTNYDANEHFTQANITTVGTVTSGNVDAVVSAATTSTAGKVELTTIAEVDAGTDTTRAVTADALHGSNRNLRFFTFDLYGPTTDVATGTVLHVRFPAPYDGEFVQDDSNPDYFMAQTETAGTTGTMVVDVHLAGTTIMSTNKIDIESGERDSTTAATQPDLTTTSFTKGQEIAVQVDAIHTTAAKGLHVRLAHRPD